MSQAMIDTVRPLIDAVGGEFIALDSVEPGDILLGWKGRVVTGTRR